MLTRFANPSRFTPSAFAAAMVALPLGSCDKSAPSAPSAPPVVPPTTARAPATNNTPQFPDTAEGAVRRFLYAWLAGDETLMQVAILPHERFRQLFAAGWMPDEARREMLQRVLNEPVKEFREGDLYPYGPPGRPKTMRVVAAGELGPDRKLMMLAERGVIVVHSEGRWRVDAAPIIEAFQSSGRFTPPPPAAPVKRATTAPAATQPSTHPASTRPVDPRL
ncbi:MAG: hypothetical protein L6Q92_14200 [Phycisphaerae bacterium]|nr:hypothetical protein [Phycisphaerae bacterium]